MISSLASRRHIKTAAAVILFVTVTAIFAHLFRFQGGSQTQRNPSTKGLVSDLGYVPGAYANTRIHLLIPATSTNYHLCQLQVTAALLGWPAPVLINWEKEEASDAYVQHLMKIEGVLDYVNGLPEDKQDDLIYMMDGYDAWFQLPAEVMIKRYYDVVEKNRQRNENDYGADVVAEHGIKDTVFFGPDKLCWPMDDKRPACWAIPDSYSPGISFGPDTDHGITNHARARWLNSGTIMGPARDVRDSFNRTLEKVHEKHVTDSDQYYFAEVFGDQAYQRRLWKMEADKRRGLDTTDDEALLKPANENDRYIPKFKEGQRTEYYIGMDFDSDMWQTIAFYDDYVTWIQHNMSSPYIKHDSKKINPHHHFELPDELVGSSPIGDTWTAADKKILPEALKSWSTVPLATNTALKIVPPVLHFTGKKGYRDLWWPRNWFYPYQGRLLARLRKKGIKDEGPDRHPLAGAWTYHEKEIGWIGWHDGLCSQFEEKLQGHKEEDEL